jgi:hypothetical protein
MIQGCRYLRRSMDWWLLSKNSTTRLKDSKVDTGPVSLCNCSIPITDIKSLYLYPCPNTTHDRLRVQHLLPKLMLWCQCPSRTRHQFVLSLYPGHVITYPRKLPFLSTNSPSVEWWRTAHRKYLYRILWGDFPAEWHFFTKLGPQVSHFPVPIFGVNDRLRLRTRVDAMEEKSSTLLIWSWRKVVGSSARCCSRAFTTPRSSGPHFIPGFPRCRVPCSYLPQAHALHRQGQGVWRPSAPRGGGW